MYFIIANNEIVGYTDNPDDGLPAGWSIQEAEGTLETVYVDTKGKVKQRPRKPSEDHIWDRKSSKWVLPQPFVAPEPPKPTEEVLITKIYNQLDDKKPIEVLLKLLVAKVFGDNQEFERRKKGLIDG